MLKSLKDGRYYIGQTNNPKKRLVKHNSGQVRSTKSRRPLTLVGYKEFETRNNARWFEYDVKQHSDKKIKFITEPKKTPDVFRRAKDGEPSRTISPWDELVSDMPSSFGGGNPDRKVGEDVIKSLETQNKSEA